MYSKNQQRRDLERNHEQKHSVRVQRPISWHRTAQIQTCTDLHQTEKYIKNGDSAMQFAPCLGMQLTAQWVIPASVLFSLCFLGLKIRRWVLQNESFGEVQHFYYQQPLNKYNVLRL